MNRLYLSSLGLLVAPALVLLAQQSDPTPAKKSADDPKASAKEAGDKGEPGKKKGDGPDAEDKESPRLKRLKQLQYARRPSAVLKLWAKPAGAEPEKKDGAPEKKKDPDLLDLELAAL